MNFPRATISDGTDVMRPETLRGLGADQVLVLVNGKRRHVASLINVNGSVGRGQAAVDLNAIPASAIAKIEVLRDGAAAQYGSDAIAGVINIVLKTGASPFEIAGKTGMTQGSFDTIGGDSVDHGDGELTEGADCAGLAQYIATVLQGMAVQAAGGATRVQLRKVADLALDAWPI